MKYVYIVRRGNDYHLENTYFSSLKAANSEMANILKVNEAKDVKEVTDRLDSFSPVILAINYLASTGTEYVKATIIVEKHELRS